jgi:unspecific monooxygenase
VILGQPTLIDSTIIAGMRDGQLVRSDKAKQAWTDISGPILLGLEGDEWKWRRKAWNPEFTATGVDRYTEMVGQACQLISHRIHQVPQGQPVEVDPLFVELTMRVMAFLLFGIPLDPKHPTPEGPPLAVQDIYQAMSVIAYRFLRVATGEKTWQKYLPTQASRDYWDARKTLEKFLLPRVELALKLRNGEITVAESGVSVLFQNSLLVKVISKEPRYTPGDLLAEMVELLIAGTDTTAHSLSFAAGELASHPEIFQKAQGLVDHVYAKYGTLSSVESLTELTYIRAIFKETLRLYSIASGSTSLQVVKPLAISQRSATRCAAGA